MYYLSVKSDDGQLLVDRDPFDDYGEAMAALDRFIRPRPGRAVLTFTTELINGQFARSFAQLRRPEDLDPEHPMFETLWRTAAKQDNAYTYERGYRFVIESEYGAAETDRIRADLDADD